MTRYLQRLITAGIFAGSLTLALHIAGNTKRTSGQKVTFALIAGGFILIGLLALAGFAFVMSQLLTYGDGSFRLFVAVALLGAAGVWFVITGLALLKGFRRD